MLFQWGKRGTAGSSIASSLRLKQVSHKYGAVQALNNISFTIQAGEKIALLGASGCGKSTLLRHIAGLENPISGEIFLDERPVFSKTIEVPPEERGIGFVFQDYALFPHLTNIGNVKFGLKHLPRDEAVSIAMRALERVGMAQRAYDYPHTLSGGMQQRVALARAIAPRPGVLLMDEPFSGLDKRLRDTVRDETLAILKETRATCIIVTHDPEEAMRMADRIILLKNGEIAQIGTAQDLYLNPQSLHVARFFSEVNEVQGIAYDQEVETPIGRFPAPFGDGTAVSLIIRPQSFELCETGNCLSGRIISKRFLGIVEQLEVAIQGVEHPLYMRKRIPIPFKVGEDVGINIIRNEVLVFTRNTD